MLVNEIIGRESELDLSSVEVDTLPMEWYELNKRIQRKVTQSGRDVAMKFISEGVQLTDGDVLYMDDSVAIVVRVIATQVILLSPKCMLEMASICYEIGNKHMPLFIEGDEIMLPYEAPMFKWLISAGYTPREESRQLINRVGGRGGSHSHDHDGGHGHSHGHSHEHSHGHHHHHHDSLLKRVVDFATKK